jgi:hypothetical protein
MYDEDFLLWKLLGGPLKLCAVEGQGGMHAFAVIQRGAQRVQDLPMFPLKRKVHVDARRSDASQEVATDLGEVFVNAARKIRRE